MMQSCMNSFISDLLALQRILERRDIPPAEAKAQAARLEKKIPPPLLAHFSRQLACDRHGVGLLRNGICSACHIKVPSVTVDDLRRTDDVVLCENCGCYLAPPPEAEAVAKEPVPVPTPAVRRRGRKKLATTVA